MIFKPPSHCILDKNAKSENCTHKNYSFAHYFPFNPICIPVFWGNNVLFILRIPADVFVMSCMLFLPFDTKITDLLSAEDILRIWLSERAGVACYLPEVMDEVFLKRK